MAAPPSRGIVDEEILVRAHLPCTPEVALRIAHVRYLGLLYKWEEVTPWALLRADQDWINTIKQDLQ